MNDRVRAHVENGGILAFCPEGLAPARESPPGAGARGRRGAAAAGGASGGSRRRRGWRRRGTRDDAAAAGDRTRDAAAPETPNARRRVRNPKTAAPSGGDDARTRGTRPPLGAINKGDPTRCLPLRRGSFQLAIDLGVPIFGFAALGQHRFWPNGAPPGRPATCRVALYAVDAWNARLASGGRGVDGATAAELADLCQAAMQASVDDLAGKAAPAEWGKSLAAMN